MSPAEIRQAAQAWYDRQLQTCARGHGAAWERNRAWIEDYLQAEVRERLEARGWRAKA